MTINGTVLLEYKKKKLKPNKQFYGLCDGFTHISVSKDVQFGKKKKKPRWAQSSFIFKIIVEKGGF